MAKKAKTVKTTVRQIVINRAPVLTLWGAVVAQRLGFDWQEALTHGCTVAGMNAYSRGRALGIFAPKPREVKKKRAALADGETLTVDLLGRAVPCVQTAGGLRAINKGKPVKPESVEKYLDGKFGEGLADAREAMTLLAMSRPAAALADEAFSLYELFRPAIPAGAVGWGAKGVLDLKKIEVLARD